MMGAAPGGVSPEARALLDEAHTLDDAIERAGAREDSAPWRDGRCSR